MEVRRAPCFVTRHPPSLVDRVLINPFFIIPKIPTNQQRGLRELENDGSRSTAYDATHGALVRICEILLRNIIY